MSMTIFEFSRISAPDCCPPGRPFRQEDRAVPGRGYGSDKYSVEGPVIAGITARSGDGETRHVSRHLPVTSHHAGIPAIYSVSLFNQGSYWGNVKTTVLVGTRMIIWHILANVHKYKYHANPDTGMSSSEAGNQIKRIPVKEPTWRDLHNLKEAGQSYDELLAGMIRREQDYRDWKMIAEIDETGEFVAFDPDDILQDD